MFFVMRLICFWVFLLEIHLHLCAEQVGYGWHIQSKKLLAVLAQMLRCFAHLSGQAMQTLFLKTLFVCFNSFRVSSDHIFLFKPYAVQFPSPRFHSFQKTCFRFLLNNRNTDKPALWGEIDVNRKHLGSLSCTLRLWLFFCMLDILMLVLFFWNSVIANLVQWYREFGALFKNRSVGVLLFVRTLANFSIQFISRRYILEFPSADYFQQFASFSLGIEMKKFESFWLGPATRFKEMRKFFYSYQMLSNYCG